MPDRLARPSLIDYGTVTEFDPDDEWPSKSTKSSGGGNTSYGTASVSSATETETEPYANEAYDDTYGSEMYQAGPYEGAAYGPGQAYY